MSQRAAIDQHDQAVLTAVEIAVSSPLFYCDGKHAVSLDGDVYTPRELAVSNIKLGMPSSSGATVTLPDHDRALGILWAANRLTGVLVTVREAVWSEGAWVIVRTFSLYADSCDRSKEGLMKIKLKGGVGLAAKAALEVADRARWRYAPNPGEAAYLTHTIIQV